MNSIKQKIVDYAQELGFLDLKIAGALPLDFEFNYYMKWLTIGYNAGMQWMEKNPEKRRDITKLLPGAKSVIVTAHSYFTGNEYPDENELNREGKISRYAWG